MSRSFFPYLGGKSLASSEIVNYIPKHKTFIEPFCGAAWVFFKKPLVNVNVLNDKNKNLVNLFRVVKSHKDEFLRLFNLLPVGTEEFQQFKFELYNDTYLTDIERGIRYLYLISLSFSSRVDESSNYYPGKSNHIKITPESVEAKLNDALTKLKYAIVENLDFVECFEKYDDEKSFFFVDSPYYGKENYYGKNLFKRDDFYVLRDILKNLKGKFLMTLNDTPEVRDIYKDFIIKDFDLIYRAGFRTKEDKNEYPEVFISNYEYKKIEKENIRKIKKNILTM